MDVRTQSLSKDTNKSSLKVNKWKLPFQTQLFVQTMKDTFSWTSSRKHDSYIKVFTANGGVQPRNNNTTEGSLTFSCSIFWIRSPLCFSFNASVRWRIAAVGWYISTTAATRRAFHGTTAPEAYRQKTMWQNKKASDRRESSGLRHQWWVMLKEEQCSQSNRNKTGNKMQHVTSKVESGEPSWNKTDKTTSTNVFCIWIQIKDQMNAETTRRSCLQRRLSRKNSNHVS